MDSLEQKKRDRFKYLNLLYEKSGGDKFKDQNIFELGAVFGFNKEKTMAIVEYLNGENLLKHTTIGGGIAITHQGVKEVENALSHPEQPTNYFPPVNIINVHHMEGSQIQQGSSSSIQTGSFKVKNSESLKEFIKFLKSKQSELNLNEDDKSELNSEISTLESQIVSSRPKTGIIKECLLSIKRILEGASGAIAAQKLLQYIPALF